MLQKVLALYHIQDSKVFVDEHGKPKVEGLEFSLSHSGNLVLCAVSEEPVGCDIERLREAPKGVAERYFSDAEQAYLSHFSADEHDREFFRIWTMKESYVKMTGEGLRVSFEAYEIAMEDTGARVIRHGEMQSCYLSTMELKGHIMSICAESSASVEIIWEDL